MRPIPRLQSASSSEAQLEAALLEACTGRDDAVAVAAQVLAAELPDVARHNPEALATQQLLAAELATLDARALPETDRSTEDVLRRVALANRLWAHSEARQLALVGEMERMQRGSPQASRTLQTVQRAISNVATLVR